MTRPIRPATTATNSEPEGGNQLSLQVVPRLTPAIFIPRRPRPRVLRTQGSFTATSRDVPVDAVRRQRPLRARLRRRHLTPRDPPAAQGPSSPAIAAGARTRIQRQDLRRARARDGGPGRGAAGVRAQARVRRSRQGLPEAPRRPDHRRRRHSRRFRQQGSGHQIGAGVRVRRGGSRDDHRDRNVGGGA